MNHPGARSVPRPRLALALAFPLTLALAPGGWVRSGDARAADDSPRPEPLLTLVEGEVVPGTLAESDRDGTIGWRSRSFAGPFQFALAEVASVRFPVDGKPAPAAGMFGLDLAEGSVLFGAIAGLDAEVVELDSPRLGRVRVDRAHVRRIFRWRDGRDLIVDGPNGLEGWRSFSAFKSIADPKPAGNPPPPAPGGMQGQQVQVAIQFQQMPGAVIHFDDGQPARPAAPAPPPGPPWAEDGGQLVTSQPGATLQADVGLPPRASIEVELSWKATPNFLLALGVGDDPKSVSRAFRFEVWEGQVIALRETDDEAALHPVGPIATGAGRVHLRINLDQEAGLMQVCSATGDRLAEVKLGGTAIPPRAGVRLTNIQGDLRFERLRVSRWDGTLARPATAGDALVALDDRTAVEGRLERFDAAAGEFVVAGKDGPTRIPRDKVEAIALPRLDQEHFETARVVFADGTELNGKWLGLADRQMALLVDGVVGNLRVPMQGVRSLEFPRREARPAPRDESLGTLELDGLKLVGRLAAPPPGQGDGAALAWQPLASETASTIRPGASGRIVYKTSGRSASTPAAVRNGVVIQNGVMIQNGARVRAAGPATEVPANRRSLYLRSGDIVPVEVTKIDEEGVYFQSGMLESHFVPNARIKALELAADDRNAPRLSKVKLDRLLTIPRSQRDSPPTHLIRSKNGDMLRGRLVGMDDKALRVEVKLAETQVPRDRISRLIWLHPDESDPSKKPAAPAPVADGPMRVQAVRTDGVRLTFDAQGFADGAIVGRSDVLGSVRVKTGELEQLLIGGMVEKEAVQLAYQNFRLHHAVEPKSATEEDGSAGGAAGTEAPLVGKPAPDFTLDLMGGEKFHLADRKGSIVVLDFWATWCGPCIQAMPQIERATREFADRGVQLVAVNLQETPAKIRPMLERLKLTPTVALDRDGAIARLYGANAIPQTVVIDRDGKVARLFVGGGPKLGDQLREAIEALLPAAQ